MAIVPAVGAEKYAELLSAIGQVVATIDPMNLIKGGAPANEYDAEVASLAIHVARADSREALAAGVASVIDQAFGTGSVTAAAMSQLVEGWWRVKWDQ